MAVLPPAVALRVCVCVCLTDSATLEWTDGVFTAVLRSVLNNVKGESTRRHWIVFDGDVDPEWAENLNSVLDDNKLLTLPTGERLTIPDNVRLMFEVQNLQHATLATVSRCGMVWYSDDVVSPEMMVSEQLSRLRRGLLGVPLFSRTAGPSVPSSTEDANGEKSVSELCGDILEPFMKSGEVVLALLEYSLSVGTSHIMIPSRGRLLTSFFSLLSSGVSNISRYNDAHQDFPLPAETVERYITKWLLLSLVWGFGGSLTAAGRASLCGFMKSLSAVPLPAGVTGKGKKDEVAIVDFGVEVATGDWRLWADSVPHVDVPSQAVLQADVVIPTVDTQRHVVRACGPVLAVCEGV